MPDFTFRKSSYSDPERECVEVATNVPGAVAIRDSKRPDGPMLHLTPAAWADFRSAVAGGRITGAPQA